MALSIRNSETEQLARELARRTGETITEAIRKALEDRLIRVSGHKAGPELVTEIMRILRRCSALPDLDTRSADEILGYDENGGFPPW